MDAEFRSHLDAVEGQTDALIGACFALLPRLGEIESMVGGCGWWEGGRVWWVRCVLRVVCCVLTACPMPISPLDAPLTVPPSQPLSVLQVRVLQCVSSSVELLGDRLRPHLATICSALPQARVVCVCWCGPGKADSWPRVLPASTGTVLLNLHLHPCLAAPICRCGR